MNKRYEAIRKRMESYPTAEYSSQMVRMLTNLCGRTSEYIEELSPISEVREKRKPPGGSARKPKPRERTAWTAVMRAVCCKK